MLLFGAGMVAVLFFTGLSACLLSLKLRILGERVAGGVLAIAMGVMLILKGSKYFL